MLKITCSFAVDFENNSLRCRSIIVEKCCEKKLKFMKSRISSASFLIHSFTSTSNFVYSKTYVRIQLYFYKYLKRIPSYNYDMYQEECKIPYIQASRNAVQFLNLA